MAATLLEVCAVPSALFRALSVLATCPASVAYQCLWANPLDCDPTLLHLLASFSVRLVWHYTHVQTCLHVTRKGARLAIVRQRKLGCSTPNSKSHKASGSNDSGLSNHSALIALMLVDGCARSGAFPKAFTAQTSASASAGR